VKADTWITRFVEQSVGRTVSTSLYRQVAVEVGDIPTVTELVRAGFGFAFVSASMVSEQRRLVLRHVRPYPEFTVSLVTSATRPASAAARALIDLIQAAYRPRS
jgi:DNA-binding transcriptional LysR family regulator